MKLRRTFKKLLLALLSLTITLCFVLGIVILYFELQLPNVSVLRDVQMQVPLRIYTSDGLLIGEYGEKKRYPVTLSAIPPNLIHAVLATEDQRFYEHPGVDPLGLIRAAVELISTGTKVQGGSTITMQVARNFFLTRKKTYSRKIREILLAIKIDSEFSKEKILELYFNKIYFGNRAYGIAAASQIYYGKPLTQLTLPQLAMIAGIPKAPSALNPLANPTAAKDRRDHVLERMLDRNYITKEQYQKALDTPLTATYHGEPITANARYIAEMVRTGMQDYFGQGAYEKGFKVYTTVNSKTQQSANKALHDSLIAYDSRHGYRGPIGNWGIPQDKQTFEIWAKNLKQIPTINQLQPAVVIGIQNRSADVLLSSGETINIPWQGLQWARKAIDDQTVGPKPNQTSDILKNGDLIYVKQQGDGLWRLTQLPKIQGALVALNPEDGAILALVGGFNFSTSNYNRVTQAERQPGSNFKPFIYAAALAKGYTLASLINDAPVVVNDPSLDTLWRPENDTRQFYGPTRLRIGLIKSRNLVSIRLLEDITPNYAVNYISRFGFNPRNLQRSLSLALGSSVVTPLELATGYSVFANGGFKVNPFLIDHIVDSTGKTIYQARPLIACESCNTSTQQDSIPQVIPPDQIAPCVITPQIAYLMTSAMKDVIQHGTGRAAKVINRTDLAGKTGTTNQQIDAWFSGYNKDVVTTTWVGFDQPQSLHEYGAQAALPMWIEFMRNYLTGNPENSMSEPSGIVTVKIDPKTGLLSRAGEQDAIFEIFRRQYAPKERTPNKTVNQDEIQEQEFGPIF